MSRPAESDPSHDCGSPVDHDPDAEELEFLERSLADLDAERDAGDMDDADYRELLGVYSERAAAVRRRAGTAAPHAGDPDDPTDRGPHGHAVDGDPALEPLDPIDYKADDPTGTAPVSRRRWRRPVAVVVVLAMVGGGLGIGLASALGSRSSLDTATGDIRQSSRGMLFEAQEHMGAGRYAEAEAIYAEVLDAEPSSAEALAWWGWLRLLQGDLPAAAERIEAAVAADGAYPDARVFGAVVALRQDRLEDAAGHLAAFETTDAAPIMSELVAAYELHERVLAGRLAAATEAGDSAAVDGLLADATADEVAAAARHLADGGQMVLAARLFGSALEADPTNVAALVGRGALLTSPDFAAFEDLLAEGVSALDRAVELAPDNPEARFWRGLALARLGLFADALADLDHLATLDAPEGLLAEGARLADEVRAAAVAPADA